MSIKLIVWGGAWDSQLKRFLLVIFVHVLSARAHPCT